jgi:hypothetical protein
LQLFVRVVYLDDSLLVYLLYKQASYPYYSYYHVAYYLE